MPERVGGEEVLPVVLRQVHLLQLVADVAAVEHARGVEWYCRAAEFRTGIYGLQRRVLLGRRGVLGQLVQHLIGVAGLFLLVVFYYRDVV